MSELKKNLYQKINNIMEESKRVKKGITVGYGNNKYKAVTHDDVTRLIQGLFVKNGVVAIPTMESHEQSEGKTSKGSLIYISKVWVSIEFINSDNPEERFTTKSFAIGFDSQDKGPGKAYSMAVKYAYLKVLMIESGDNEEERVSNGETVTIHQRTNRKNVPPSQKQLDYLDMLLKEKYGFDVPQEILDYIPKMTIDQVSKKIEELNDFLGKGKK